MNKSEQTLLIQHQTIAELLDMTTAIEAVEEVFRIYGSGNVQMPPKSYLQFAAGDLRCMPTYVPELGFACVKNVSVHPHNTSLPTVQASITLFDPNSGFPLAMMDGTLITAFRTAASAAVATRLLARKDASLLGFLGVGRQAYAQVEALLKVLPACKSIIVYDVKKAKAEKTQKDWTEKYSLKIEIADTIESLLANTDVLTTTTPTSEPLILMQHIHQGLHINAIGADAKGKQEIATEVMTGATIIIDNWEQASHSGEINVPLASGILTKNDIQGDIGQLVTGQIPGRTSVEEITVFDSTGLAIQDLACAVAIYQSLLKRPEILKNLQRISF